MGTVLLCGVWSVLASLCGVTTDSFRGCLKDEDSTHLSTEGHCAFSVAGDGNVAATESWGRAREMGSHLCGGFLCADLDTRLATYPLTANVCRVVWCAEKNPPVLASSPEVSCDLRSLAEAGSHGRGL